MPGAEHDADTVIVISAERDCLLRVSDPAYPDITAAFTVNSKKLKATSQYFTNLFDPKFSEGSDFAIRSKELLTKYGDLKNAPHSALPVINVIGIGRIGTIKDFRSLVTDLLRVVHGLGLIKKQVSVPIANLANLAIVADRFDVTTMLRTYAHQHNIFASTQKRKSVVSNETWNEERARMRLLIAVLLDHLPWFQESLSIILKGSSQWRQSHVGTADAALWWDLPRGLEEELNFRRQAIIKSLATLLTRCLALYVSGTLQCKLGYANSIQCDVFQLGQSVRFYNKHGLLNLETTMAGTDGRDPFDGDIQRALDVLKQCPSYQIDKFHAHCGMRDKLTRIVDMLQSTLPGITICGDCWTKRNRDVGWQYAKPLPIAILKTAEKIPGCYNAHARIRDFYVANDKNWSE